MPDRAVHLSVHRPRSKANFNSREQHLLHTEHPRNLPQGHRKQVDDMTTQYIGLDAVEFTIKYFERPADYSSAHTKPVFDVNPFAELKDANDLGEPELRATFVDIINRNYLAPGLGLGDCHAKPDSATVDPDRQKPDAAFYRTSAVPSDGKPHWIDQLMPVEFKAWKSGVNLQDPYTDKPDVPGGVAVTPSTLRTKNFGQIISYAEMVFLVQQRVAVLMLLVVGRTCRFLRWEHAGAIVSQSIDYYKDWEFFCDILWHMSRCTDEKLGVDPSAMRLTEEHEEFKAMDQAAIASANDVDETERTLDVVPQGPFTFKYVRDMFRNHLDVQWPRYKLEVPDGDTKRHFLVCKPVFHAKGLIGRGTRGYVALDCNTGRFVWLKDAWRAYYLLLEKEGDVLAKLKKAEVPYIPTLVCHGDIRDQTTLTSQEWERQNPDPKATRGTTQTSHEPGVGGASSSSSKRKRTDDESDDTPPPKGLSDPDLPFREDSPLRIHKHYRLVEEEVAMPLNAFQTAEQLVSIIYQCIYAHYEAATNPLHPILHRDVSGGNILICPRVVSDADAGTHAIEWSGLLGDWEMSKPFVKESARPVGQRQPERTGTWQFMSVALLSLSKSVEICDELEAFFYVLLYYAARYLQSNVDAFTLANYLDAFFDQYTATKEGYECGVTKMRAIETGKLVIREGLQLRFGGPIDDLIAILLQWFKSHHVVTVYNRRLEEDLQRQAAQAPKSVPPRTIGARPSGRSKLLKDRMNRPGQGSATSRVVRTQGKPSSEDWEDWENVKTHRPIIELFDDHLFEAWPKSKNIGDRIPKLWVRPVLDSAATKTTSSNKRARAEHKGGMATAFPIPPSQRAPPQSPPRHAATLPANAFWIHQAGTKDPESLPP